MLPHEGNDFVSLRWRYCELGAEDCLQLVQYSLAKNKSWSVVSTCRLVAQSDDVSLRCRKLSHHGARNASWEIPDICVFSTFGNPLDWLKH